MEGLQVAVEMGIMAWALMGLFAWAVVSHL